MDDKATKAKLLKGAKRKPFDVVPKKTCINMEYSDGAFQNTVKPSLNIWKNCKKDNEVFNYEGIFKVDIESIFLEF